MPKQITVNACQTLEPAAPHWSPEDPNGTLDVDYVVGNLTGGVFIAYPAATVNGHASIPLSSTQTAPQEYQALGAAILALEELDPTQGDTVLFA